VRRSVVPIVTSAAAATVTVLGAVLVVASCGDTGGVREEGIAGTADTASVKAYATPAAGADPVKLVKNDLKVDADIREDLVACSHSGGSYPVNARLGDLTGGGTDMVVNVSTCEDTVGIGSYVYQLRKGKYYNVFVDEQPPVVAEIGEDGELKVTHQVYEPQDPVSNPSGENITSYRWTGTRFREVSSIHHAYKDS
jgi:azurin